jgi:ankyrin repeat protein
VGLSQSALSENRDLIKAYFRDKWLCGELEEQPEEGIISSESRSIAPPSILSGTTARGDRRESDIETTSLPIVFDNPFAHLDQTPTIRATSDTTAHLSTISSLTTKLRKSSLSSSLFKFFGSDAALLDAASDNDIKKVLSLIRKGANVNVKDKWGWAPMSMAAYGGYADIAKLLIEAGADLEYRDVDGDGPLDLAESKGHTDVVLIIQEEMTKRATEHG